MNQAHPIPTLARWCVCLHRTRACIALQMLTACHMLQMISILQRRKTSTICTSCRCPPSGKKVTDVPKTYIRNQAICLQLDRAQSGACQQYKYFARLNDICFIVLQMNSRRKTGLAPSVRRSSRRPGREHVGCTLMPACPYFGCCQVCAS